MITHLQDGSLSGILKDLQPDSVFLLVSFFFQVEEGVNKGRVRIVLGCVLGKLKR